MLSKLIKGLAYRESLSQHDGNFSSLSMKRNLQPSQKGARRAVLGAMRAFLLESTDGLTENLILLYLT